MPYGVVPNRSACAVTRFVESTITFPYKRSLGPVLGAFMTALTEKRILGVRNGQAILVPPMEWDPATGAELAPELVEVGPAGTVESWTWVPASSEQHPLNQPFAFAFIRLDGASTPLLHAVDVGERASMVDGMRVAPRWRGRRIGHITDICCFVPGERPEVDGPDEGPADQPVELMDYLALITYRSPIPVMADRAREASLQNRLIGLRCPTCGRVYVGGTGMCPIDSIEFGPDAEIELPHTGTITNFVVVTPVQYPGQTETEPFARAFVLIDGFDVVLSYQPVIELPVEDLRIGMRVAAVWASAAEEGDRLSGTDQPLGNLIGWIPNGETDVNDPDLVNRVY